MTERSSSPRKFWCMDALRASQALKAPVDTIENLQAASTPFTENEQPPGAFATQMPLSWSDDLLCALSLLIMPGCFLWLIPVTFYIGYVAWTLSVFHVGVLLGGFAAILAFTYAWFVAYPDRFVPKLLAYFSLRVVWEDGYAPATHSILFAPPHGVFPYGSLLVILLYRLLIRNPIRGAAANVVFDLPISAQFFRWVGVIPATGKAITAMLDSGHPMAVSPGGVREIFHASADHETIIAQERKGLVRIALKTGAQLVPCYIFGNTSLYHLYSDKSGRLQRMSQWLRTGVLFFWGRWGLPIAYRAPLLMVYGRPIDVTKVDAPTPEQVDALHATLMVRLKDVYDTHRTAYGWTDRDLVIV